MNNPKEISLTTSLFPVILLISMLTYNILMFEDKEWLGEYTYQLILLITSLVVSLIGLANRVSIKTIVTKIYLSIKSIATPIIILLLVGALAGTWKVSGVIPAMVYYGLQLIDPSIFLPLSLIVSSLYQFLLVAHIPLLHSWNSSSSSWYCFSDTTRMTAGAVLSGAYFGDKLSPLSDTTNLAPAMAGTDLYTHIKYMTYTTVPTILITLVVFSIISLNINTESSGNLDSITSLTDTIINDFYISPILFMVPVSVIILAALKVKPVIALSIGISLAIIFTVIFQSNIIDLLSPGSYSSIFDSVFLNTEIPTDNERISDLYNSGGMIGMIWTINLTICAMIFGGAMDAIGALTKITNKLLSLANSTFGLVASTVVSCLGINIAASDQYLAIVIPGKMFKNAYEEYDLAPENLSRTLEDSGTVTSALIPWNTCGAYHYGVLGVSVADYFIYAIFNWLSPIMTLIYAGIGIKIRSITKQSD